MTDPTDDKKKSPDDLKPRATFFDQLIRLSFGAGIIISLATALRPLALHWWIADVFCQFAIQYVLLMIPVLVIVIAGKRWKAVFVFAIFFGINLSIIWAYVSPFSGNESKGEDHPFSQNFRLLSQNVQTSNRNYQALINLVNKEQPDFLILMEIDQQWIEALKPLHGDYPYRNAVAHPGNFGIGIYSRIRWASCEIRAMGPENLPTVFARFAGSGQGYQQVTIIGTHPVPPIGASRSMSRNKQLLEVANSQKERGLTILTGDFNLTPWSPWFRKLLFNGRVHKFYDASVGFDIRPTWRIFPTLLGGVKIDHVLIGDRNPVLNYRIGPEIGSDHRGIILDFEAGLIALLEPKG